MKTFAGLYNSASRKEYLRLSRIEIRNFCLHCNHFLSFFHHRIRSKTLYHIQDSGGYAAVQPAILLCMKFFELEAAFQITCLDFAYFKPDILDEFVAGNH